jgi:hypothetical protein
MSRSGLDRAQVRAPDERNPTVGRRSTLGSSGAANPKAGGPALTASGCRHKSATPVHADRVATATVAATEMKSAMPRTYPRYWCEVGNMGTGETFADSSDEIGDSTGYFQYSFLPYCAGRVG